MTTATHTNIEKLKSCIAENILDADQFIMDSQEDQDNGGNDYPYSTYVILSKASRMIDELMKVVDSIPTK
jgi:hypothetical protein